jgi:serine/threonine protein kinase
MNTKINLGNKYILLRELGKGSFGELYLTSDHKNNLFAAKIENKQNSRLKDEYKIYKKLHKSGVKVGVPQIKTYFSTDKINVLVMELLGKSLDGLLDEFGINQQENIKIFDLSTVLKLSITIIDLLKNIHNAGFIHRDIKPNNFLIGNEDNSNKLFIMDFGLSKQYVDKKKHIGMRIERSLIGTARYASVNVHMGFEPSRRDDLEAVGYMLIYFLKGKLPWQGLKDKKDVDKIKLIGDTKMYTNLKKLCNDLPECFYKYINYCKKLSFNETPDYDYLKTLFTTTATDKNIELIYCWNKLK